MPAYLLARATTAARARACCPSLRDKRVSPHVIRHTTAMHLLEVEGQARRQRRWKSARGRTDRVVREDAMHGTSGGPDRSHGCGRHVQDRRCARRLLWVTFPACCASRSRSHAGSGTAERSVSTCQFANDMPAVQRTFARGRRAPDAPRPSRRSAAHDGARARNGGRRSSAPLTAAQVALIAAWINGRARND